MVFTIVVAIFVLGVLIFVHELGHFLAAKLVNIQVLRFSIGLGKPLISRYWGETEYSISAIPFGGYVKMAGDDPTEGLEGQVEEKKVTTDPARHFDKKGIFQRFLVIFSGPLSNFLLAIVLYIAILYFQGAETWPSITVEFVRQELSLPGMENIRGGSKILLANGMEVGNWHEIEEAVLNSSAPRTTLTLYDSLLQSSYTVSVPTASDSTRIRLVYAMVPLVEPRLGSIIPGKPASKAGLKRGDLILSINGKPIHSWQEITRIIQVSAGITLNMVVDRAGEKLSVEIVPEKGKIPQGDYSLKEVGLIGIAAPMQRVDLGFADALVMGSEKTVSLTIFIVRSLGQLLKGIVTRNIALSEARNYLGGPVMIGQMAGESARSGELWLFMALLSINLAILNLLPIPVLDGGHLLFLFIELVRFGKPLTPEQRMRMIQVGLLIVLGLMVLATANDLGRLFGL
ncbi:MAG TPA: RIP metalloprotease RseP [archaeon]|nr:RIP metalloprotease RseP [archaeon]